MVISPSASQTLMQLVVNSSRSCFTVYFSGFKTKKKNQKLKKTQVLKSKMQREEAVTDIFLVIMLFFFFFFLIFRTCPFLLWVGC